MTGTRDRDADVIVVGGGWGTRHMKNPLLMIDLLRAVYWFDDALQGTLKRGGIEGVTRAQSLLIANIAAGEQRAIRLARNLGITRQSVGQMIAELEARNIISVEPDPDDRRARVVSFSPASAPLRDAARYTLEHVQEELRRRIGASNYEGISAGLQAAWGEPPIIELSPADAGLKPARRDDGRA